MSSNAPPSFPRHARQFIWAGGLALFIALLAAAAPEKFEVHPGEVSSARVVIVQDSRALEALSPRPEIIRDMVRRGLLHFTRESTEAAAWRSLLSTQDVVGLKVHAAPGANSGTRPAVVAAVIESLRDFGVPPRQIVIWDKRLADLKSSGFDTLAKRYGARVAASLETGYDEKNFYDSALPGQPVFGDLEFGRSAANVGRRSFVTKLLTKKITKIINLTPLFNHNLTGVSGSLSTLALASVDNTIRFESHFSRVAQAVPEIYALPAVGEHVALHIVDALLCQYQGEERALLHYSAALNQLRFSNDPVALDVLSLEELDRQRRAANIYLTSGNTNLMELYRNAALLELGVSERARIRVEEAR
ncbi:MAG: DUF362 domain-containing protein [Verrucomicrobia bacterium]|nr:DUF362 domain-containing protein [Verrucomicrobiota bacterium]